MPSFNRFALDHENTDELRQFKIETISETEVRVLVAKELDREEIGSYELHVLAIDQGKDWGGTF